MMIGEIIAVGDELLCGRILNTTSSFAARQLFAAGHQICAMTTIGDIPEMIGRAINQAVGRADFIIVTGGLGATSDDLTNEAVVKALNRPATFHPEIFDLLNSGGGDNKKQADPGGQTADNPVAVDPGEGGGPGSHDLEKLAWLPTGATVLKPKARMAGYYLVYDDKPIFFLPGVPHEMKELMTECVIARLAAWKGGAVHEVRQMIYRVFGLPEVRINLKMHELESNDRRARIGYYPVYPDVHVSLTVTADDSGGIEDLFGRFDREIRDILGENLYGCGTETMEAMVGRLLKEQDKTVAVAESCTGGLVAGKITRVPGSSAYFNGGVVAYSNELKRDILGVDDDIIRRHGAVSSFTARAMAEGGRRLTAADFCVAVTGIAGPEGGNKTKPVGTVYFGLAAPDETIDFHAVFSGSRWQIQEMAAQKALDLMRRKLSGYSME